MDQAQRSQDLKILVWHSVKFVHWFMNLLSFHIDAFLYHREFLKFSFLILILSTVTVLKVESFKKKATKNHAPYHNTAKISNTFAIQLG